MKPKTRLTVRRLAQYSKTVMDFYMSNPPLTLSHAEQSRYKILAAGAKLACKGNYLTITRDAVAAEAGVSPGLINYRFKDMDRFREDLMRYAIRHAILPVVLQGLVADDGHARRAPAHLKQSARELLG